MVGTVVLATVVAFSSGLGTKTAEKIGRGSSPLLTYSISIQPVECFSGIFLPDDTAREVLERPPPENWDAIEAASGAIPVGRDDIQVSIQGESERKITLTGITVHVRHRPIPNGDAFYRPCGGPFIGRALEVALGKSPPQIIASSAERRGMVQPEDSVRRYSRPIRFPWTVSVTDPLLLDVLGNAEHCYCTWAAEIPWVSGAARGVIQINDEGKEFHVMSRQGLTEHATDFEGGWTTRAP